MNNTETTNTDLYLYHVNVLIPYGQLKNLINWCFKSCGNNDWAYADSEDAWFDGSYGAARNSAYNAYKFMFKEEADYFTFLLKHVDSVVIDINS